MTKFNLQQIDESLLEEHSLLIPEDRCYFFGDYAGKQGFRHSPMNDLMQNFKKPVERKKNRNEWQYKEKAVNEIASLLKQTKKWDKLKRFLWIPMPSSKHKTDPDYDDRLMMVLNVLKKDEPELDVRELLILKSSRDAVHNPGKSRLAIEDHVKNFDFDLSNKEPQPHDAIVVFDDVITTGASFKAAQITLEKQYPNVPIAGIFIARSVKQN